MAQDPEFMEEEGDDDAPDNDDSVDDKYSHDCDFPLYEIPVGNLNEKI